MQNKLLVICYTFPPFSGVGGRRWAKFAKYLERSNCDVSIIAAKKQESSQSPWTADVLTYSHKVAFIDSNYPLILQSNPRSFWQKLKYHLALFYVKLVLKGNYYDASSFWQKNLTKATERKILEGYNNVLVSCGPFKMASFVLYLKKKYPDVNFIADFRDPWTNNKTSFGYTTISPQRLSYEKLLEQKVVNHFNYILTVSDEMTKYFYDLSDGNNVERFRTLINGFDKDDFQKEVLSKKHEGKLTFVFTGTLYNKSMHIFEEFCNALKLFKTENIELYQAMQVEFYGQMSNSFRDITKDIDCIYFGGELPLQKVYEKISGADVAMLFLSDDLNYSFSTKFYEYISQNISIAVFSKEGRTGHFVEENGLGYSCFSGRVKVGIELIFQDWEMGILKRNSSFDTTNFDVEKISDQIQDILI